MRFYWFGLLSMVLYGTMSFAQQQPQARPPAAPVNPTRLGDCLQNWEKSMQDVQTLYAQITRTDVNTTFQSTQVFNGVAQYMKLKAGRQTSNLACLDMQQKGKQGVFEKFVCTGDFFYQWRPQQKEIVVQPLPQSKPGEAADDNFFSFLFGMKADSARNRYDIRIHKEDDFYIYLLIQPRTNQDRNEFQMAELVLDKRTFLPARLWFRQPNGNHTTWDVNKLQTGIALDRNVFIKPVVPQGWRLVQNQPNEPPPRVYRPQK